MARGRTSRAWPARTRVISSRISRRSASTASGSAPDARAVASRCRPSVSSQAERRQLIEDLDRRLHRRLVGLGEQPGEAGELGAAP